MKVALKPRPIGQFLRSSLKTKINSSSLLTKSSILSIDEQIALLEKSVKSDGGSPPSDGSDSDEESEVDKEGNDVHLDRDEENHLLVEKDESGNVVRLISAIDEDKIAPLPKEMLPGLYCSTSKKYARSLTDSGAERQKRIRFNDHPSTNSVPHSSSGRGLESTVREFLNQYEPASHERRPFYCRVCKHQAADLTEFEAHKLTDKHLANSEVERKVSFCKLCKKQFTSPEQLKEHLKGKWHMERLERMKEYQQNRKKFS